MISSFPPQHKQIYMSALTVKILQNYETKMLVPNMQQLNICTGMNTVMSICAHIVKQTHTSVQQLSARVHEHFLTIDNCSFFRYDNIV